MMCLFHFVTKYGVLRKVVDNDAVKMVMNILIRLGVVLYPIEN